MVEGALSSDVIEDRMDYTTTAKGGADEDLQESGGDGDPMQLSETIKLGPPPHPPLHQTILMRQSIRRHRKTWITS